MDPNANLEEQLDIAASILEGKDEDPVLSEQQVLDRAVRLAELVQELDEWIVAKKGFLPMRWKLQP